MAEITKTIDSLTFNIHYDDKQDYFYNRNQWIGQSAVSTGYGEIIDTEGFSYRNNKFYIEINLTNENLKLKNIKHLEFNLQYRMIPMLYDTSYCDIVLLLGCNNNNINFIDKLKSSDFVLYRPASNQYQGDTKSKTILYYYDTTQDDDHYQSTGISLGGTLNDKVQINNPGQTITNENQRNIILFKPSPELSLHNYDPATQVYNKPSDVEEIKFSLDLNPIETYDKYYLFVAGPIIYQYFLNTLINPGEAQQLDYWRSPNGPAALQIMKNGNQIGTTLTLTNIIGDQRLIPIQIPASWSGDIIKAEDSITKDFQRLDSILQALQSNEYGWNMFSDYPINPALTTPTQQDSFIITDYTRPLQKIYELCMPYEATEYNNETSTHKACYAVRQLGDPSQSFFTIPKLDVYYNALKELYPDCFVIEENE